MAAGTYREPSSLGWRRGTHVDLAAALGAGRAPPAPTPPPTLAFHASVVLYSLRSFPFGFFPQHWLLKHSVRPGFCHRCGSVGSCRKHTTHSQLFPDRFFSTVENPPFAMAVPWCVSSRARAAATSSTDGSRARRPAATTPRSPWRRVRRFLCAELSARGVAAQIVDGSAKGSRR